MPPIPQVTAAAAPAGPAARTPIRIGTAAWSIPSSCAGEFPHAGTHLARYGEVMCVTEINSSFYRPHRKATYERWAESVPPDFRFSAKTPRALTRERSLIVDHEVLSAFAASIAGLGAKLAVLLVQLAPKIAFDAAAAGVLFSSLRECLPVAIACEPRHVSWAAPAARELLEEFAVARVAADPPRWEGNDHPGGEAALAYFRWHGSPRIYYSDYAGAPLEELAARLRAAAARATDVWCILDNTALGHALGNALALRRLLSG